ncbi:MAG: putative signal transducing protein [Bacteroidia bacterium]
MEQDWVKVYSSAKFHQVHIIKAILEENNIASVDMNKRDSSYNFGEIELYVKKEDEIKAHYLIRQQEV